MRATAITSLCCLTSALLLLLATPGCAPEVNCSKLGCPWGERCNEETGLCEQPSRDCNVTGCPEGQICDQSSLRCQQEQPSCVETGCPDGQVCNAMEGYCENPPRCDPSVCAAQGQVCDVEFDTCVDQRCAVDSDCPLGVLCLNEVCRLGCRLDAPRCPADRQCVPSLDGALGDCAPPCEEDTDCLYGFACDEGLCEQEPPCSSDGDCRSDESCLNSKCTRAPCLADGDCAEGEVCDVARGLCLGGRCEEDVFAPNHSAAQARALEETEYRELASCAGRPDFYTFQLEAFDRLELRMSHDPDDDLDLYLYNEEGELLAVNQERNVTSTLRFLATEPLRVVAEVRSTRFVDVDYDLSLGVMRDLCEDDVYEDNDSRARAFGLPSSLGRNELPLQLCGADEDWFVLRGLPADRQLRVELQQVDNPDPFAESLDSLELHLFGPQGLRQRIEGDESFELLRLGAQGDYYLQARTPLGQIGDYRIVLQLQSAYVCPNQGANTSPETAAQVAETVPTELYFCPANAIWEIDWIELASPQNDAYLNVRLSPGEGVPADLRMALVAIDGQGQANVLRNATPQADGRIELRARVEAGADLRLRLNSDAPVASLLQEPRYEIFYLYEQE